MTGIVPFGFYLQVHNTRPKNLTVDFKILIYFSFRCKSLDSSTPRKLIYESMPITAHPTLSPTSVQAASAQAGLSENTALVSLHFPTHTSIFCLVLVGLYNS